MKPILFLVFAVMSLAFALGVTGCAPAEEDADGVADTAIKGLSGQGTLTNEKPTKDSFGSDYQ
jgi:hypothetical protein